MKWFKHYCDNHRGRSIQDLLDKMGHTGLCYFLLMELCAEKLERIDDKEVTEADCLFAFHPRVVRQNLRISPANLRRLLDVCAANGLLSFKISGSSLEIKMPILLNLLNRDEISARKTRANAATKTRLDIEEDKELEEEGEVAKEPLPRLSVLWNEYCGGLAKVEKTNSARNKKTKALFAEHSESEWIEIIKRVAASDFCNGINDRGWKATFDFLLKSETSLRVIEGKYDNRVPSNTIDLNRRRSWHE